MTKHGLAILVLPALLSLAACEDPAKDVPKAVVTTATAAPAPAPAPTTTAATTQAAMGTTAAPAPAPAPAPLAIPADALVLETASVVGFIGSKVTGKHEGKFEKATGYISLAGGKAEGGKLVIEVDMSSVKTDQEKLDGHLKSADFFDVAKYPQAIFTSTAIKAGGEKGATHTITGDLELHGEKKTLTFPATIKVTPDGATGTAEFSINRKDFKVVYAGKPDDLIRDDVVLKLTLKAHKKG
jgi:polyisoprenoid-binding protein YceI